MNDSSQDFPMGRSPKRELQGPRPTPLRINNDSHKIKKPPVAPPPSQPPRRPVIIYTVSPKVIHTTPSDFMSVVQRLTGKVTTNHDSVTNNNDNDSNVMSSCATLETITTTKKMVKEHPSGNISDVVGGVNVVSEGMLERPNMFHGILSESPSSSSPIPSNLFSPPSTDPNMVSFFHDDDLSPVLHSNKNFMEDTFIIPSSSSTFVSPRTPSSDLFNIFSDDQNN